MEKILFASDLDGTLLNDNALVAPEYATMLNALTDRGCLFTIASARSPAGARRALDPSGVRLSAPAVCLNGYLLWDFAADSPVQWFAMERRTADAVLDCFSRHKAMGRLFVVNEDGIPLTTYYRDDVVLDARTTAYLRATDSPRSPVRPLSIWRGEGELLEFSCCDHHSRLDALYEELVRIEGLQVVYYADTYSEGYRFLECGAANGGKGAGAKAAQKLVGADRLYVFGDNFNDLPMYEVADKSFAPDTAEPEMQKIATQVIPSHNEGGVIRTIRDIFLAQ